MTICTMFMRTFKACVSVALLLCLTAVAQVKPPVEPWPTYHGDYSGRRHSPLAAITPANVNQLAQVWRFQIGQMQQIKASPIVVNGILYVSTPDNLWAIDARSGDELWHYTAPKNNAFHIGHRG